MHGYEVRDTGYWVLCIEYWVLGVLRAKVACGLPSGIKGWKMAVTALTVQSVCILENKNRAHTNEKVK